MDRTALWHYLTFIVAPAPLTMFRNIFKIPAGWRVSIDHTGRAKAEQWWNCEPDRALVYDPAKVSVLGLPPVIILWTVITAICSCFLIGLAVRAAREREDDAA